MPSDTDLTREAQKIWNALRPMVRQEATDVAKAAVRAKKMTVMTPPNGSTVGVAEPFGPTLDVPYSTAISHLVVGDSVWVQYFYDNASTMFVVCKGDGQTFGGEYPLTIAQGGTGLTVSPSLLVNLASTSAANVFTDSPRPGVTGTLPIARGGTGATTLASGAALIGNGTNAVTTRAITNLTSDGTVTANINLITANTLVHYANNRLGSYLPLTGGTLTGALTLSTGDVDIQKGNLFIGGDTNYRGVTIKGGSGSPLLHIRNTGARLTLDQYANGSTGGERYLLPTPETRSADVWYDILTTKKVVTVAQGGTGANNVTNALKNLHVYHSVIQLGLTSGSATFSDVWSAMPNNSIAFFPASDFASSELPNSNDNVGSIRIFRYSTTRSSIEWIKKTFDQTAETAIAYMPLNGINVPAGYWVFPMRNATTSTHGLMTAPDKEKLDGLNDSNYLHLTGGTMTGDLTIDSHQIMIKEDWYPHLILKPTKDNTTNVSRIEGSLYGKLSMQTWNDDTGNNRRILDLQNSSDNSSLTDSLVLREIKNGTEVGNYKVFTTAGGTLTGQLELATTAGAGYEVIRFGQTAGSTEFAIGKNDDGTARRSITFRQYRPSGTYRENYSLPSTTDSLTASVSYNILTTKTLNGVTGCSGLVGQSGSTTTNPWYKVATGTASSGNYDCELVLLVEDTYSSHNYGVLRIHTRTQSGAFDTAHSDLTWLINTGFTNSDFVLVCPTTNNTAPELWTRVATAYMGRKFTVLSEGHRTASSATWTLLNAFTAGQAASITTAGTQIVSVVGGKYATGSSPSTVSGSFKITAPANNGLVGVVSYEGGAYKIGVESTTSPETFQRYEILTDKYPVLVSQGGTGCDDAGTITTVNGSTISVPNNTLTNLGSITLAPGVYAIQVICNFADNSTTGYRQIGLAASTTSANMDRYSIVRTGGASGGNTSLSFTEFYTVSAQTTYYANARQTSGGALNCYCGIRAIKIAGV